jgi:Tropinone reductase 1
VERLRSSLVHLKALASTAREFAGLGADVIAVARGQQALDEAFASSTENVECISADVSTPDGRAKLRLALEKRERLDVLVNNVGTNIRKRAMDYSADELNSVYCRQIWYRQSR